MNNKVTKQAIISSVPIFGYVGAGFAFGILAKKYDISLLKTLTRGNKVWRDAHEKDLHWT